MKRNEALAYVLDELKSIKKTILENKSVSPIRFLELSEIFKFKIEPSSDRFNAICLTEIAKKNTDKEYLKMIDEILDEEDVDEGDTEEEIDELVDFDGSIMSSKIPLGTTDNKTMSSKKTTDAVVGATRQSGTWSGAGHYFRKERLKKLSEDRARDMIEVILSKNSTPGELTKEPTDIMDGKLKKVINYYKKDKDLSDLVGRVEDMWNNE